MCGIDDLSIILLAKQNELKRVAKMNSTATSPKRTKRQKLKQRVYMVVRK